ncbi:MAG: DUF5916 domain-containing protein [Acidobacteriota bacterium]
MGALTLAGPTLAQSAELGDRPVLRAAPFAEAPDLDGDVLNDPAWRGLDAATGFVQNTPDEGEPATEKTEVFIGFDAETLYVGVVCFDRDPSSIIISDSRRDASLLETDSFQVLFDTFGDQQTGFIFGTNPAGLQYDGQTSGDGGDFNLNWDGAFEVEAKVFDGGWSAEFAIPFRTLRFPNGEQHWGLNFQRNIRRRNERAYWAELPRQFELDRVSMAGRLEGLEVPRQRLLQVTPYVLAAAEEGRPDDPDRDEDVEFGFDLKYGLTPSLTLDATYNTDFAQVEADVQQVNLDRFNLFFPEKRPFFLENAGSFSVGVPEEVELFFSRRIGLGAGGANIPIDGGLRLTGKAGRTNVGLLYMSTDDLDGLDGAGNDFAVIRVSQDLGDRSSVGFIATGREGRGGDDDYGRTYGVDGRWGITQELEVLGFAARTDTPGMHDDDRAFRIGGRWDSELITGRLNYTEVGEGFNPEIGFLARRGFRKGDGFILWRHRPKDLWGLQEMRPHISYRGFWDFDGFQQTGFLHIDNHWEWKNGHEIHTGVNFTREGVKTPFEIFPGVVVPPGSYDHSEIQFVAFTNRGAAVGAEVRLFAGGFFGGDRVAVTPTFRFRVGERFNAELVWAHNDIDLPGGAFTTNLGRLRIAYSFSPEVFLEALLQYNDRQDRWSTNLRFGWRQDSSTGFFVVYNENQEIGAGVIEPQRRLIVKFSRLFDLFRS